MFGIFYVRTDVDACNCTQGAVRTPEESALGADSGRKIPCCIGNSNLHLHYPWLFSRTLHQLSYFGLRDFPGVKIPGRPTEILSLRQQTEAPSMCMHAKRPPTHVKDPAVQVTDSSMDYGNTKLTQHAQYL